LRPGSAPAEARAAWASAPALAVLALLFNALTWGLSWWPLRWLEQRGLHALWATALVYLVASAFIVLWRPAAPRLLWQSRRLWWLALAAGTTNATFNWAVTVGDVVRVVLLFYLMPLWAVLLSRLLLNERLTFAAATRVLLALTGALVVLWPADGGWPWPRDQADALAILGGFSFALNNVMLRREAAAPEEARALAMFGGGVLVATLMAAWLTAGGHIASAPALSLGWAAGALALAAAFLGGNLALQYGAARLPANTTAAVMVAEVLFAAVSSVAVGAAAVTPQLLLGGALIVLAALLAAWRG
jgi:drug/metabolite transporter (DMT)-like permease